MYIYLGEVNIIPTRVIPISISYVTYEVVSVKGEGLPLPPLRSIRPTFWEYLLCGGGEKM
jgi:hypothetical protein